MQQQYTNDELMPAATDASEDPRQFMRVFWWTAGGLLLGALIIGAVWMLAGQGDDTAASLLVSEVRRPAPDFALPAFNGDTVRLNDHRGKVVLVNFWATWCVWPSASRL